MSNLTENRQYGAGRTNDRFLSPSRPYAWQQWMASLVRMHAEVSCPEMPPNKALQLTANALRGLSAAELGR